MSLPPVIWVLGGPGSCKATRVAKAVQGRPWKVVNFGYVVVVVSVIRNDDGAIFVD